MLRLLVAVAKDDLLAADQALTIAQRRQIASASRYQQVLDEMHHAVPCPTCGAGVKDQCRGLSWMICHGTHLARMDAAAGTVTPDLTYVQEQIALRQQAALPGWWLDLTGVWWPPTVTCWLTGSNR